MRTSFSPVLPPRTRPDPRVAGVHVDLNGLRITGGFPKREEWGRIVFTSLDGWWNAPGTTGATTQNTFADGGWNNRAFRTPRVLRLIGWLDGPDRPSVRRGIETLMASIALDAPQPFAVLEDGLQRHVMARQEGDPKVTWSGQGHHFAEYDIQLVAHDPRKFAGNSSDDGWATWGPTGLPRTQGGLSFPLSLPASIGAVTVSGRLTVTAGSTGAPPEVRIVFTGPVSRPSISDESGRRLWFDLDLTEGQELAVNLNDRSVRLNGVSRRGAKRGEWLSPAGTETYSFTAARHDDAAQMTILTKDAWL